MKRRKTVTDRFQSLVTYLDPKSTVSETYRTLRTNLQFGSVDKQIRTIVVTSSGPAEGKSTTISNLAVVLAQSGKKVLLVDADMRKPALHHFFRIPNQRGLSNLLSNQNALEDVVQKTMVEGLFVIPSGPIPPNPAEMLGSKRMAAQLETFKSQYDYVLLDTPPVVAVTDAQLLAGEVDGVLLVIHSGVTHKEMAVKAKQQLEHVRAHIIGVILNNRKMGRESYYYYYNYYG